jgi:hypothetical protein
MMNMDGLLMASLTLKADVMPKPFASPKKKNPKFGMLSAMAQS